MSGKFLGHDRQGVLCCSADRQFEWEHFVPRPMPEGGYVLLMTGWWALWHVGIKVENGWKKLAKLKEGAAGGVVWEFEKVYV